MLSAAYSAVEKLDSPLVPIHSGHKRKQREEEQKHQVRPQNSVAHRLHFIDQVMVVDPINPNLDKGQQVEKERRPTTRRPAQPSCAGTFNSSTMMVIITAITPSEKASRRAGLRFSLLTPLP